MDDPHFYSIIEFAQIVRVHPNTIRRAIRGGRISAIRVGQGATAAYRIPASEIDRLALCNLRDVIDNLVEEKLNDRPSL